MATRRLFRPSTASGLRTSLSPTTLSRRPFLRPRGQPSSSSLPRRTFWSSAPPPPEAEFVPQIASELLPYLVAILLFTNRNQDSSQSPEDDDPPYEVVNTSRKGKGAVSRRTIERGQVIVSEQPLVVWPQSLDADRAKELVDALTPQARRAYFALANAAPNNELDEALAIRATNGFNVELPPVPENLLADRGVSGSEKPSHVSFVFPRVARINHSCLPNADHSIDCGLPFFWPVPML
jgi:hypothetical protein